MVRFWSTGSTCSATWIADLAGYRRLRMTWYPCEPPMRNVPRFALFLLCGFACGRTPLDGINATGGGLSMGGAAGEGGVLSMGGRLASGGTCGPRHIPIHHRQAGVACPQERAPGSVFVNTCSSVFAGQCTQDTDCTAGMNGRCLPNMRLSCAGQCDYDTCFGDSDCPASQPCACRQSASDSAANSCLNGSNCRIDADCGPCGFCSPTPISLCVCTSQAFCNPPDPHASCGDSCGHGYFCHTPQDTCLEDSDCTGHDTCNFDLPSQTWACTWCMAVP
jgi:hypothetical protein